MSATTEAQSARPDRESAREPLRIRGRAVRTPGVRYQSESSASLRSGHNQPVEPERGSRRCQARDAIRRYSRVAEQARAREQLTRRDPRSITLADRTKHRSRARRSCEYPTDPLAPAAGLSHVPDVTAAWPPTRARCPPRRMRSPGSSAAPDTASLPPDQTTKVRTSASRSRPTRREAVVEPDVARTI